MKIQALVSDFNGTRGFKRLLLCLCFCCNDAEQAPNRDDEGFLENMLEGLDKAIRVMRSPAFRTILRI
jgi:hypothetical protein